MGSVYSAGRRWISAIVCACMCVSVLDHFHLVYCAPLSVYRCVTACGVGL